jgi:hypothetical protein
MRHGLTLLAALWTERQRLLNGSDVGQALLTKNEGKSCAANLHGAVARTDLQRRRVVGSRGRRSGTGGGVCRLHGALGEGVSLGVAKIFGRVSF